MWSKVIENIICSLSDGCKLIFGMTFGLVCIGLFVISILGQIQLDTLRACDLVDSTNV